MLLNGVSIGAVAIATVGEPVPPSEYPRVASGNATRSIHSGHSLTDAYIHYGPYPTFFGNVIASFGITAPETKFLKAVVPGSSIQARWEHDAERFPDPATSPIRGAGDFDMLMITEVSPPAFVTDENTMTPSQDHFMRFAANMIENGRGNEVIIWSNWPDLAGITGYTGWDGMSFRQSLPHFGNTARYMADYATYKMHQLYPALPDDWRVWIIPGHAFMMRLYDDVGAGIVPGVTDIAQLFDDDPNDGVVDGIHPNPNLMYGLACFAATCMYQVNLTTNNDTWIAPAYTHTNGSQWPAVSQALAEYFWQMSWDVATDYEPVGMGGTTQSTPQWTLATDGDLFPDWTLDDPDTGGGVDPEPEPEPGELPDDLMGMITPTSVTGFAFAPALPAAVGGVRTMTTEHGVAAPGVRYMAIRARRDVGGPILSGMTVNPLASFYGAPAVIAAGSTGIVAGGGWIAQVLRPGLEPEFAVLGSPLGTDPHTVEIWYDQATNTVYGSLDGDATVSTAMDGAGYDLAHLSLNKDGYGFEMISFTALARIPTDGERESIRTALTSL